MIGALIIGCPGGLDRRKADEHPGADCCAISLSAWRAPSWAAPCLGHWAFMRMVFLPSCWWALRAHACSSGSGGSCSAEGTAPSSPKAGTIRGLGPNGSNGFFDRYSAGDPEKGSPALCGSRRPAARKGTLRGLCAAAAPPGFSTASKARSARRRGR